MLLQQLTPSQWVHSTPGILTGTPIKGTPVSISPELPILGFTFANGNSSIFVKRSFDLGDTQKPKSTAIYRRSRSSLVYGYAKNSNYQILTLSCSHIQRNTIRSIVAFLKTNLGRPLKLTLDDQSTWLGYIVDDPFETVANGKLNSSFQIKFEGILQNG